MEYSKSDSLQSERINLIEKKIATNEITEDDLSFLLEMAGLKNEFASFVYGLYLLLERKDENAAIEWIKQVKGKCVAK